MSTFDQALKAVQAAGGISETRYWWSEFSPGPVCPPDCDACFLWFVDRSQATPSCPDGLLTHVCIDGKTYAWGKCTPGNLTGDGRWYQPITYNGAVTSTLPLPACYNYFGVPTLVSSADELLEFYNSQHFPAAALAVQQVAGGSAQALCFDPEQTLPGAAPQADLRPTCNIGQLLATSNNLPPAPWFCPPPAPYGPGTVGFPNPAGLPTSQRHGWYGPLRINCGTSAIAEISVNYTSASTQDQGNQNTYAGWLLMDSLGSQVSLDLEVTPISNTGSGPPTQCNSSSGTSVSYQYQCFNSLGQPPGPGDSTSWWGSSDGGATWFDTGAPCSGPQPGGSAGGSGAAPRPFVPFQQGVNVIETAVTLSPLAVGVDYWVHWGQVSSSPGVTMNSISVSCIVS